MADVGDRFWSKVRKDGSSCWEWTANKDRKGYGKFGLAGRTVGAHRVAYMLTRGPLLDPKLCVCHHCDNPSCVNPAHLFLGTKSDNAHDMIQKGRNWFTSDPGRRATGAAAHRARLTETEVSETFRLRALGLSQRAIAMRVGVSQSHVSRLLAGRCWPAFAKAG